MTIRPVQHLSSPFYSQHRRSGDRTLSTHTRTYLCNLTYCDWGRPGRTSCSCFCSFRFDYTIPSLSHTTRTTRFISTWNILVKFIFFFPIFPIFSYLFLFFPFIVVAQPLMDIHSTACAVCHNARVALARPQKSNMQVRSRNLSTEIPVRLSSQSISSGMIG